MNFRISKTKGERGIKEENTMENIKRLCGYDPSLIQKIQNRWEQSDNFTPK